MPSHVTARSEIIVVSFEIDILISSESRDLISKYQGGCSDLWDPITEKGEDDVFKSRLIFIHANMSSFNLPLNNKLHLLQLFCYPLI